MHYFMHARKINIMIKQQCAETWLSLEKVLEQIDDISILDCFANEETKALLIELDVPSSYDEFSDCEGPIAEESGR